MAELTGLTAIPTLDGVDLKRSPEVLQFERTEMSSVRRLGTGRAIETRVLYDEFDDFPNALMPTKRYHHTFTLDFQHLGDGMHEVVEELMSVPGAHSLVIWKPITLSYFGTGTKLEFWMPWQVAVHLFTVPPNLSASDVEPAVKINRNTTPLTYQVKDQTSYDAGNPPSGEVWFLDSGRVFKIDSNLSLTDVVFLTVIPVFRAYKGAVESKRYAGLPTPFREPKQIVFSEVA